MIPLTFSDSTYLDRFNIVRSARTERSRRKVRKTPTRKKGTTKKTREKSKSQLSMELFDNIPLDDTKIRRVLKTMPEGQKAKFLLNQFSLRKRQTNEENSTKSQG